jgi:hypothetical protein
MSRAEQIEQAAREAYEMMLTWFSGEYAEHPAAKRLRAALALPAEAAPAAAQPPPDLARRVEVLETALTELVIAIGEEVRARPPLPAKPYAFTTPRLEQADLQARAALAGAAQPQAPDVEATRRAFLTGMEEAARIVERQQIDGTGVDPGTRDTFAKVIRIRAAALESIPRSAQSQAEGALDAIRDFLERWPLAGYELEAYCDATLVPALRTLAAAPRPETPPSHYADCDSRIGLECNCGAAPRPSTDKEGA